MALARSALDGLALERVWLMPVSEPVHKTGELDPGAAHRLAMCKLAAAGEPGVGVCTLEVERGGRSYTVESLRAIHASHPDAQLTFIVGADTAAALPDWREPLAVLELCELAVAARTGTAREMVLDTLARLGGPAAGERVRFLQMPAIDVSSSQARERAARGASTAGLLNAEVAGYIEAHALYRDAVEAQR
jgi:nicotinate-nucleotide adenylyltransferase